MSKIDIDKLVVSYIETMNTISNSNNGYSSLFKTKVNAIKNLLKNQGLEVKDGEIVEIQESFNIEQGKQYVCIKDYIIGGEHLPTSCLFTKGKLYHSRVNGYLINNEGKSYYIYDSDKKRYFRPATEVEISHKNNCSDCVNSKGCINCENGELKETIAPKFKVGDFIANNYCFGKVIELTDDAYLLDTGQGIPFSCEHNVHLWTVEDAKNGDVLVSTWKGHSYIYIFKEIESNAIVSHIYYYPELDTISDGIVNMANTPTVPATKEQRDILFKRMKEAGYEWNAEKKELKKIDPMFKVGDYVIDNDGYIFHIIEVLENLYHLENMDGGGLLPYIKWVDKNCRLWSIEDAKPGDVLATEDKNFTSPFIAIYKSLGDTVYKGLRDNITFNSHCFIGFNGIFYEGEEGHAIEDIHPATKEQRDILFAKMKESGYEWDADKKELEKIVNEEQIKKNLQDNSFRRMFEQKP